MRKFELIELITTHQHIIEAKDSGLLKDPDAESLTHYDKLLLDKLDGLTRLPEFQNKGNEEEIHFSDFINTLNLSELQFDIEAEKQVAKIFRLWLSESDSSNITTFMGTDISEIPLKNLVYLDGTYQDIEEMLSSMESNKGQGKNIFANPSSVSNTMFSPSAIEILKAHPVTAQFIYQYEEEQRELEAKQKDIPFE